VRRIGKLSSDRSIFHILSPHHLILFGVLMPNDSGVKGRGCAKPPHWFKNTSFYQLAEAAALDLRKDFLRFHFMKPNIK
jgi:hypothetical protein